LKRCTVACDTATGILLCELELPEQATIADALMAARAVLGERTAPWDQAATGIFGKLLGRTHVWASGDRIELYRALQLDPRARRRQRAAPHRGTRSKPRGSR
jgi:putative ubiquitin-RnfH superfamily antitoxin RatB of RatAB toxin-antitoxin module